MFAGRKFRYLTCNSLKLFKASGSLYLNGCNQLALQGVEMEFHLTSEHTATDTSLQLHTLRFTAERSPFGELSLLTEIHLTQTNPIPLMNIRDKDTLCVCPLRTHALGASHRFAFHPLVGIQRTRRFHIRAGRMNLRTGTIRLIRELLRSLLRSLCEE